MRTLAVLRHLKAKHGARYPGQEMHVLLACGADLLESMTIPGVWIPDQLVQILSEFKLIVFPRHGYDRDAIVGRSEVLSAHRTNIICADEPLITNISSTIVRDSLARGHSIKYLVPDPVIAYMHEHGLYQSKPKPNPQ